MSYQFNNTLEEINYVVTGTETPILLSVREKEIIRKVVEHIDKKYKQSEPVKTEPIEYVQDGNKFTPVEKSKIVKDKPDLPRQIEVGEWLYKGCFIQENVFSQLNFKYSVFQNTKEQQTVGTCNTFGEAKSIARKNEVKDEYLKF